MGIEDGSIVSLAMKSEIMAVEKSSGEDLKAWREEAGLSREYVAQQAEITPQYLSLIELNRRHPSSNLLIKLSQLYPNHTEELLKMAGVGDMLVNAVAVKMPLHPVVGYVSCGVPVETYEVDLGVYPVPQEVHDQYPDSKYLEVRGDSLKGDGIEDGDHLLVNPAANTFVPNKIYVVRINGDVCVRRVVVEGQQIILKSSNGDYPDISGKPVEPVGQVVYHMKGRRV